MPRQDGHFLCAMETAVTGRTFLRASWRWRLGPFRRAHDHLAAAFLLPAAKSGEHRADVASESFGVGFPRAAYFSKNRVRFHDGLAKPSGTVPILRSPRSKMGLSPSPTQFC
jgi:hypothetical protein